MNWLARNGSAIQSLAAIFTAIVALGALIGVKVQLDEADRLQNLQSAREAYRSHLTLAVANPEYAAPENTCAFLSSSKGAAYMAFVDHLLYSAEQMLEVEEDWEQTFKEELEPHAAFLCSLKSPAGGTPAMSKLLINIKSAEFCNKVVSCD